MCDINDLLCRCPNYISASLNLTKKKIIQKKAEQIQHLGKSTLVSLKGNQVW